VPLPVVIGDPHFIGFKGQKYDFHGRAYKVFNLITDTNFQMNAQFVNANLRPKKTKTYLGEVGVKIGANLIHVICDRENDAKVTLFNKIPMNIDELYQLDHGTVSADDSSKVTIKSQKYNIMVKFSQSNHSSCHLNIKAEYKAGDYEKPKGILGFSAHDLPVEFFNSLEQHWEKFVVKSGDLFGDDFEDNQFLGHHGTDALSSSSNEDASWLTASGE